MNGDRVASCLIALLLFASCMSAPTQQKIASADYGSYPDKYQDIIKSYLATKLFDPYSAVYSDWIGPSQGYSGDPFSGSVFGYRVCVRVNAKNRYGAYVGSRLYHFVIHDGSIVKMYGGDEPNSISSIAAEKFCSQM